MPYRESWEDPEVFCTLPDGTKIYRTYPDDDFSKGHLANWFTLLPLASESCSTDIEWSFDVRLLPPIDGADIETDPGKITIIQAAYDDGLLLPHMHCPGGCSSCAPLLPESLEKMSIK